MNCPAASWANSTNGPSSVSVFYCYYIMLLNRLVWSAASKGEVLFLAAN